ncbi:MAG: FAD-binding oxidoreductase [Candidatus Thiodiazotropha lotti]|uniref:FAD-binding oxidoreductase n=1 Tax=Candidatus Thiodiazotropha lotti TaxID=2792787 RepID=A0A9E4K2Q5_9GAMM|nr:FAD-binding oxidoreductase [Candidatus Thiodiazotropha lotti]MCG7922480.1 FAD-binding oxidoreductase [Candidatus Thiodiazotropha lotti]MCG7929322.1 FAD-binding oxidoreductase [Candidatus Thiodiazotropha lotti]MCG7937918.1 FAD-binding oxidoreductase [Candidatus Thiodiazotropha lotti]MCG7989296.1 FAD-binding oxidoreductase [Candidatus Thiodiazotropha lotti]
MPESTDDMHLENSCDAVIKSTARISPESADEVRQLVLQIDDPTFRYAAGQSIGVLVPGPHVFGNEYHHRRYSIANPIQTGNNEAIELEILVRRCFYLDEISGERYPGIASNYLCDAKIGDKLKITGPFRSPFKIPANKSSNLLMIGTGTGIAPFRAFVRQIYDQHGSWDGQVRLFYGDNGGMNLLYMNDEQKDLGQYYDDETFKAFSALTDRPMIGVESGLQDSLAANAEECKKLITDPNTYVFLGGQEKAAEVFNKVMEESFGSADAWNQQKQSLIEKDRWAELLYH